MDIFNKPLPNFDKSWTLFLDRDGVLNHEKHLDYIHKWDEFIFYPDVKEALQICANIFNRIIVVTNQRGVGKGMTLEVDLHIIHQNMKDEVAQAGGSIDRVYYCPDLNNESQNRKPNAGMAFQAKLDYPEIDFNKSVMVGNNLSDMGFGRKIGSYNVFVKTTHPEQQNEEGMIDLMTDSLFSFSKQLVKAH